VDVYGGLWREIRQKPKMVKILAKKGVKNRETAEIG